MKLTRLYRIICRCKDYKYLKYLIIQVYTNQRLVYQLKKLHKYHLGYIKDFKTIRNRKLKFILKYAYNNTEYYKKIFSENKITINRKINNWNNIPFLTKEIIRNEKNNILVFSKSKKNIYFRTTGGSTGEPFGFFSLGSVDPQHQVFLYKIMGYCKGDRILAMDGTIVPKNLLNQNIFWVFKNKTDIPYGSMALSSQYLNEENICYYVDFIKTFKPSIIRGYPSFINTVSLYILKNKIELNFKIKGIEITSESFDEYQIENIKKAFNSKVYNQYGHSEDSIFGYSVDDSMLTYCSPFTGYTEVIGKNSKQVKKGEIGEVVVTGFSNYAMPFIRYRTGDLALYEGDENGIVKLKRIYGRTQDYVYTEKKDKILLTAIIFGMHYKALNNIVKWQIIQDIPGEITFKIIRGVDYNAENEEELQRNFYEIAKIKTSFEYVDFLPLTSRGKSKLLVQNILL